MATNRTYVEEYAARWKSSRHDFPFTLKTVTASEQRTCDMMLDRYAASVRAFRTGSQRHELRTHAEARRFIAETRALLCNGLRFTDEQVKVMFSDDVVDVTRQFVRQARHFDPALTINQIFQACRNVWIMNGLQIVLGTPASLTPSVFAYSLLYPYTDNLIDDPGTSAEAKRTFSRKLMLRLLGRFPEPADAAEEKVFSLVGMIEEEFPRPAHPDVYESLRAIHAAQTGSLQLFHSGGALSEIDALRICIAKGGASVVADGCLVAGRLSAEQEYFLFGYGAYLQLVDDLQDAAEDRAAGLSTMFSRRGALLEADLNRTYWFGDRVMQDLPLWGSRHLETFTSLMRTSMALLLIDTVAKNADSFSEDYVSAVEDSSPFSFASMRTQKERFASSHGIVRTVLDEIAYRVDAPAAHVHECMERITARSSDLV